jgi:hypothetical protein
VEPDRGPDAGLSNGCEIGAGNEIAEGERNRLRLEDDGVRKAGQSHAFRILQSVIDSLRDGNESA